MRDLEKSIDDRFAELLVAFFPQDGEFIEWSATSFARAWLIGAANLIGVATGRRGLHFDQAEQVIGQLPAEGPVPAVLYQNMMGALRATADDRRHGLLADVRYADMAAT